MARALPRSGQQLGERSAFSRARGGQWLAFCMLALAAVLGCGCTKILGDFKLEATTPPVVDAGKDVTPVEIIVSPVDGLQTTEWGDRTSFTIVLKTAPRANVAIALSVMPASEATVAPESVTFTPTNWNAPQTVFVTGERDGVPDGNTIYTVETSPASSGDLHFHLMDPVDVTILNIDDQTPGFNITPTTGLITSEGRTSATFTIALNAQPQQIVTIDLLSSFAGEGTVSPASLAFSPSNYRSPQTVTVTGVDDNDFDGPGMYQITTQPARSSDPAYDGLNPQDVRVINLDDESPGVTITPMGRLVTSENTLQAAFTVALSGPPMSDVSMAVSSSSTKEGTVSPASLTFTSANWRALQTVIITGVDDDVADGNQPYTVSIAALQSADDRFKGIDPPDLEVINVDNDSAGLIVTPQSTLMTSEDGLSATFGVVLAAKPMGEVTINLTSTAPLEGSLSSKRITFSPLSWNAPQFVTIVGNDDGTAIDGDVQYHVRGTIDVANSDPDYGALPGFEVTVVNLDNDTPGVSVTPIDGLTTTEEGGKATFNVALRSKPAADVRIDLSSSTTEGSVHPSSLTFTPANYGAPQKVTVTGVDDTQRDGNQWFLVITAPAVSTDDKYKNLDAPNVTVVNLDNDTAGVVVVKSGDLVTTEAGGTASFTMQLSTAPKSDVAINLSCSNPAEGDVTPAIVTFTAANWSSPQTVTVSGKDDPFADGPQAHRVIIASATSPDLEYQGLETEDIPVTNLDNETPSVVVSATTPLVTTESGGTATFTIALGSLPSGSVTLLISSSRPSEGTVGPNQLVFNATNWKSPQVVTVTGFDDTAIDGNQPFIILLSSTASTDSGYNNLKPLDVPVINLDNETAGVTVMAARGLATSENGASAQFSVVLNAPPKSDVTIPLRSSLTTEGTVHPPRLVFTATDWNAPQKVTVTGVDDTAADGTRAYRIILDPPMSGDAAYTAIDPNDVDLINLDNDAPAIQVIPPKIATTTETSGSTTFGVYLLARPTDVVTIPVVSSNVSEGTVSKGTLKFTPSNYAAPQWIAVTGVDDTTIDGDAPYRITVGPASGAAYQGKRGSDVWLVNLDNDAPGLAVSPASGNTTEGGIATNFTVALNTRPSATVTVPIASARPSEGMPLVASLVFTTDNWNAPQTVTVRGIDDRNADGDQIYRVVVGPSASGDGTPMSGDPNYRGKRAPDVVITNLDDDTPAIRVTAAQDLKTTEARGTAKFAVVLASAPMGDVTLPLVSRDPSEGTITDPLVPNLVFTSSNWSIAQTVTVTGADDPDADGSMPYAVRFLPATGDARYAGRTADDVMLTNIDDDSPGVTVSGALNLTTTEAGGTATFRMVLNIAPTAAVIFFMRSSNPAEGTVPALVQFLTDNWNVPQTVTIAGQQDTVADGNQVYAIVIEPAESSDLGYKDLTVDPLPVINLDDDTVAPPLAKQRPPSSRPRRSPATEVHPSR